MGRKKVIDFISFTVVLAACEHGHTTEKEMCGKPYSDVSGMLACLKELANIKEEWNKTYGFEDSRDLSINRDDASSLRRTADFLEWLANYR